MIKRDYFTSYNNIQKAIIYRRFILFAELRTIEYLVKLVTFRFFNSLFF